jgi:molybdopterin-synthase adenylyltransferase
MHLTDHSRRYIRQTQLAEIGESGQQRLGQTRVLIIGAGGIGAPALTYLNAAGLGTLGIIDADRVEISNLNRQILFEEADIGRLKTDAARDALEEQNSATRILTYAHAITAENAAAIINDYDIILDGCDDFSTRHAVNAACVRTQKPLISASVLGWKGQLTSFNARMKPSPCYACFVHPDAPNANTCTSAGIIGAVAGIMGSMAALEVIHTALGTPKLIGTLVMFDGLTHTQRHVTLPRDSACAVCS